MKLTIVNQFYPPDISPTARLVASLAEYRAAEGDRVTVVAGRGYATINDGGLAVEVGKEVRLLDVWTPKLGKKNILCRCVDCLCFFLLASWRLMWLRRQDAIICLTTPPFIMVAAVVHKLLHPRTRLILWNMDCYPEVLERGGMIRERSLPSRLLRKLDRALVRRTDHIVCLDDAMQQLVAQRHERGRQQHNFSVIPNWEPLSRFPDRRIQCDGKAKSENFVVLYAGNLGYGHCHDTLIEAADRLAKEDPSVQFMIVGGGTRHKSLRGECEQRGLGNLAISSYLDEAELKRVKENAGCAVITLRDEMLGVMSPSKLHSSLAMGLPIVYVGPAGSNVDEAIRRFQCGISLRHGDVIGFVNFVRLLSSTPSERAAYSRRARQAFEAEYCDRSALPKFDRVIRSVAQPANRRAA